MAYPRVAIKKLMIRQESSFGVGTGTAFPVLCWDHDFDLAQRTAESPEGKTGIYRNKQLMLDTKAEIKFSAYLRTKPTGVDDELNTLLEYGLGLVQVDSSAKSVAVQAAPPPTTTGCDVANGVLFAATVGETILVSDATGVYHAVELTSWADNAGPDSITWLPALPSAPLAGALIKGTDQYCATGDASAKSIEITWQGDDNSMKYTLNGCKGSAILHLEPGSDHPFPWMEFVFKAQKNAFATPAALAAYQDQQDAPLPLNAGITTLLGTYTAGVRDTTRVTLGVSKVIFDLGHELAEVQDASYTNNIAGFKNTLSDKALVGTVTLHWYLSRYTALTSQTPLQLLMYTGDINSMFAFSWPRISFAAIKAATAGGLVTLDATFHAREHIDYRSASYPTAPANALDGTNFRIARYPNP